MSKSNVSKQNKRQAAKPKRDRKTAERMTLERKAQRMMRELRAQPDNAQLAAALADLVYRNPSLRNVRV